MAAVERIEHRDAVGARYHGLSVHGERLGTQLGGRAGNRRISVGPVVAPTGEQPHRVAIAADN
jgi:hypothetical protein